MTFEELLNRLHRAYTEDGDEMDPIFEEYRGVVLESADKFANVLVDGRFSPTFRAWVLETYVCSDLPIPAGERYRMVMAGIRSNNSRIQVSAISCAKTLDEEGRRAVRPELDMLIATQSDPNVVEAARSLVPDKVRCVGGPIHGHTVDYQGPEMLFMATHDGPTRDLRRHEYSIRIGQVYGRTLLFYVHSEKVPTWSTEIVRLIDAGLAAEKKA
jgi:hypothetical protein